MGNSLKENSSKRIKELRLSKNYTMEKLAELVGVSKSTVAKWENGYVDNMRQDRVAKLAEIFNVSPAYIMGYNVADLQTANNLQAANRIETFVNEYNNLNDSDKSIIDNLIESLLSKQEQ